MVEVMNQGFLIPYLGRRASVLDVDVHEGLQSGRDLLPYQDEP